MKSITESQQLLKLTHANTKQPMLINSFVLFAWYHSEGHKATYLVSTNGGVIPVLETIEQVSEQMLGITKQPQGATQ